MMGPYWHMYDNGRWTANWWGISFEILVWVLIAVFVIWLFTRLLKITGSNSGSPTALDILKIRFAKGEISKEEFDKMKEDLK
ncbi:MAG TPA: SHOCT domain-containing protein [Desulfitobacteriaceae bacterium]|nr:SHOCT domain-containing protein [Desulfitobacteriaceae bacterium]